MGKTSIDSSKPTTTKLSVGDEEMKREKRRAANRRSALKSRYRETVMLEELQRNTQELSVQNSTLRQENETLRSLATTIRRVQSEAQQAAQMVRNEILLQPWMRSVRVPVWFSPLFFLCFITEVLIDACRSKHKHVSTSIATPWNFLWATVKCNQCCTATTSSAANANRGFGPASTVDVGPKKKLHVITITIISKFSQSWLRSFLNSFFSRVFLVWIEKIKEVNLHYIIRIRYKLAYTYLVECLELPSDFSHHGPSLCEYRRFAAKRTNVWPQHDP
jgi:hypothetical protein